MRVTTIHLMDYHHTGMPGLTMCSAVTVSTVSLQVAACKPFAPNKPGQAVPQSNMPQQTVQGLNQTHPLSCSLLFKVKGETA